MKRKVGCGEKKKPIRSLNIAYANRRGGREERDKARCGRRVRTLSRVVAVRSLWFMNICIRQLRGASSTVVLRW